ncbi:MAG: 8-oxo-dGTP diphosphatase MutT, partial [Gammaproteobacteria bacterium]
TYYKLKIMSQSIFIHAVGGVIFNVENKILIAKRPLDKYLGGLWEIPGGKIESGETSLEALTRELTEEVGIKIVEAQFWFSTQHRYPDREVKLDVWKVPRFVGKAYGVEGQAVQWVAIEELRDYPIPAGSQEIIEKLLSEFCS